MGKLFSNERGAAIIELALIAPVFALMTIGIVDMSNAYSRKLQLEQGVQRAIEMVQQTTQDDTVDNTIKNEVVCQVNGTDSSGNCITTTPITSSDVTVNYRLECTSSSGTVTTKLDAAAADDCASSETQAMYISATVTDKYTPMFPIHFMGLDADGTYHLSATAGMRTQ